MDEASTFRFRSYRGGLNVPWVCRRLRPQDGLVHTAASDPGLRLSLERFFLPGRTCASLLLGQDAGPP